MIIDCIVIISKKYYYIKCSNIFKSYNSIFDPKIIEMYLLSKMENNHSNMVIKYYHLLVN